MDEWKQQLWDTYGHPQILDAATVLKLLGLRDQVHPRDAVAFLYPNQETADAYASANQTHYRLGLLGQMPVPQGVLSVLDLRPQITEHGLKATDPSEPDQR